MANKKQSKMEHFKVYHLDIDRLEKLRRAKDAEAILDDEQLDAVERWESLCTTITKKKLDRLIFTEKKRVRPAAITKSKDALSLLDMGFYEHVADVDWPYFDLKQVVKLTTSINSRWVLTNNPRVNVVTDIDRRDTHQWDLIEHNGTYYLVMPLGFVNTEEGQWAA